MDSANLTALAYPFDDLPAPGHAIEVAPGLRWVRMRLPFALDHINLWLLDDGEALAVVDCGFAREETRESWNAVLAADRDVAGRPESPPQHMGAVRLAAAIGVAEEPTPERAIAMASISSMNPIAPPSWRAALRSALK